MERTNYNVTAKHSAPMWQIEVPTTIEVTTRRERFGLLADYLGSE